MSFDYQPLMGVRVVEMSHMIMGPSCGMFLGFLGAEVIKVEPPEGDKTRHLSGMGRGFYPTFNRGKHSIKLDLKTKDGLEAMDRLIASADVFVENFRDESLARMGLAPGTLKEKYPRLIISSCKGFLNGPYEHRTAMDEVVQMMTGMAYMTGPVGRPLRIGSSANDIMAGLFGAFGVLGALLQRASDDKGRTVRTGLFENCLLLVAQHMVQFDIEGREAPPMPDREFSWPVYDIFNTSDDRQIFIGAVTEGQWQTLCDILGLADLKADPQLQKRMDQIEARDWTIPVIANAVATQTFSDLVRDFDKTGIPFSPISRPAEMYDDPHVNRVGGLYTSALPEGQTYRAPGFPFEIDGVAPKPYGVDIEDIGQSTFDILSSLDMNEAQINRASGKTKGEAL
tara:strand:- start:972 stop:2162 length:1191 start_codon:yes stop_codon:yes gene_type:complete